MKKSKFLTIMALALICMSVLISCKSVDESTEDNKINGNDESISYNGVTNPAADAPQAHRVTMPATTTPVTTITTVPATTTTVAETTTEEVTTAETTIETTVETQTTTTAQQNISGSDIVFQISNENSWEQEGSTVYQYELSITNNSSTDLSNWSIEIPLSDPASNFMQGWSADYSVSESKLIITGVDYNATLVPGANTSVGFQIASASPIQISDAVLITNSGNFTLN